MVFRTSQGAIIARKRISARVSPGRYRYSAGLVSAIKPQVTANHSQFPREPCFPVPRVMTKAAVKSSALAAKSQISEVGHRKKMGLDVQMHAAQNPTRSPSVLTPNAKIATPVAAAIMHCKPRRMIADTGEQLPNSRNAVATR
jgi:hypothetical protein